MSTPFTHTRPVPVVMAKNTQHSHSSCSATSTTVMVTRFRMRLKKRTIGERKNIGLPSSFIIICVSIARFCSFFKICVVS